MRATILLGGFRKKNTWQMASAFLRGLESAGHTGEILQVKNYKIAPCVGCESCYTTGVCIVRDEMTKIYDAIDRSDILVMASPMYFYMVSSDLKAVIDRAQPYWERTKRQKATEGLTKKLGVVLASNGGPFEQNAFHALYRPMRTYFGSVYAEYLVEYFVSNTDHNPVAERPEVLAEIEAIGAQLQSGKHVSVHR